MSVCAILTSGWGLPDPLGVFGGGSFTGIAQAGGGHTAFGCIPGNFAGENFSATLLLQLCVVPTAGLGTLGFIESAIGGGALG